MHVASIGHLKLHNYDAINDQHQLIRDAVHSNPVAGMVSHIVDSINSGYANPQNNNKYLVVTSQISKPPKQE